MSAPSLDAQAVVVVTMCSEARLRHVRAQQRLLEEWAPEAGRVVVWLDDAEAPPFDGAIVVRVPPGRHGLRLAAGRNAGARAAIEAGGRVLVFLDADCVPGRSLVGSYAEAAARLPEALLVGAVTYLAEGVGVGDGSRLDELTRPHPARPAPAPGTLSRSGEYSLFWSLSFAVTAATWERVGGFDEAYEGYGGEDTDFAYGARDLGVPLVWVGGADAYHQHHPTSSPPWQHLDDILRNGRIFAQRWGAWPMGGWIDAFADAGAIVPSASRGWVRAAG
ncbi:galactosyltransferase-like protein [Frondihabitans sp. PhB188]|uniref:glycosyltransferase family 2 protein n=1 Tax=Frondihabitans sp. PhB188 TaxID=2485200 RepID=UPI000FA258E1|nr:galactosyltransferase-related protein [Frondihabitans sp. PhB188]ROQ38779.1 galactosyltransferase-like protein [Frondihabitans sp. PhB188]